MGVCEAWTLGVVYES